MSEAPLVIGQIGVELRPEALQRDDASLALSLDGVFSLGGEKTMELEHDLTSQQFGLELAASWLIPIGPELELGIGALAGVRLEVARLEEDDIATGTQNRLLPHFGFQGLARYQLGHDLHLDLTARGARVLTGPATEFEIETADGDSVEVLAPREWLGEGILSLGLRF